MLLQRLSQLKPLTTTCALRRRDSNFKRRSVTVVLVEISLSNGCWWVSKMLHCIIYDTCTLKVMNQSMLPSKVEYVDVMGTEDAWTLLNKMEVKGEGATAIVACLAISLDLKADTFTDKLWLKIKLDAKVNYLLSANPYAAIIRVAFQRIVALSERLYNDKGETVDTMKEKLIEALDSSLQKDFADNKALGAAGANYIAAFRCEEKFTVLTHGHTGALVTGGWGTALGVVKSLHNLGKLEMLYFTDTNRSSVGAYITAYELMHETLPHALITDRFVETFFTRGALSAVIIGAFAVALNGDVAFEPGSYRIAAIAASHGVPFYVAAATSTFNRVPTGEQMDIWKAGSFISYIPTRGQCYWNPKYDIVPAKFISAIITEKAVCSPKDIQALKL